MHLERRGQMYQIIFWEAVLFGAGAVIVGNLAGIGIYQLVIPAFEKITEQTLPSGDCMGRSPFGNWLQYLMYCCKLWTQCSTASLLLKEKKKKVQEKKGKVQEDRPAQRREEFYFINGRCIECVRV